MTDKDVRQELITQEEAEHWKKVLRGELTPEENDNTQREADMIRSYLIKRDQDKAIQSLALDDIRNDISPEQSRLIYRQASQAIHKRATPNRLGQLMPYLLGALVGASVVIFTYLLVADEHGPLTTLATIELDVSRLNNGDYRIAKPGEAPDKYPNMLPMRGGSFTMGCSAGWDNGLGCKRDEYPPHDVSIESFDIAQHEVTVNQFEHFVESTNYKTTAEASGQGCGQINAINHSPNPIEQRQTNWRTPGFTQESQFPVTCVSWEDAHAYIDWLSLQLGEQYRLPSEAEWEYAARSGLATAFYWGGQPDPKYANYSSEAKYNNWAHTAPVGSYPANEFALHDMAGNVAEWVEDCSHRTYAFAPNDGSAWTELCADINVRVLRGGAWNSRGQDIRAANREFADKATSRPNFGFRVARSYTPN